MPAEANNNSEMTEVEIKTLIRDSIRDAIAETRTPAVAGDVKTLVESAVANAIKDADGSSLSAEDVKAIVDTALKSVRRGSKMQHNDGSGPIEFPIAHRAGNLSVANKQLLNVLQKKSMNDGIPESLLVDADRRGVAAEDRLIARMGSKALTTSDAGGGAEWMAVGLSSVLLARMYMESKLAQALVSQEVQMPTNPFRYPLSTTRPRFRLNAEGVDAVASNPGTGNVLLEAAKLTALCEYTYEAEEDAIIAILPQILTQLGEAAADALEDAIINGDTATVHQDSDTETDPKHGNRAFDGVRKLALAVAELRADLTTGGVIAQNISAMRRALGRWGLDPSKLLLIVGANAYNDCILLDETLTAEKVGNPGNARILTGVAPNIFGIDIVPSFRCREDLNASGVYDGVTTTKGSVLLVYKPGWIIGTRRGFTVETERSITSQKHHVVASFRRDLKPLEALHAEHARLCVIGYKY